VSPVAPAESSPFFVLGRRAKRHRTSKAGTLFILPALLVLVTVVLVPLGVAVYTSLTNESLISVRPAEFTGLENYRTQVLSADFWASLLVTVQIIVFSLLIQVLVGYVLAHTLVRHFRGRAVFRAVVTLPMLLTPVAVGLMWRFLTDPNLGLIRWISSAVDSSAHPNLLGSPAGAMALIVAVNTWINVPFVTLLLLAGLLAIPDELYEAAALDGANWFMVERYITLPMLLPVLAITCALRVAIDYRMFDLIYVVTQGGPGNATRNLSLLAYQEGIVNFDIGGASAIAVAMAIIALPAYFLLLRVMRP
jgi:ABC-type sugar transport system permease subunit